MTIESEKQQLSQDAVISLFRLDLSSFGESPALFTPHVLPDGSPVRFGADTYASVALSADGFAWSGSGAKVAPKITLNKRNPSLLSLLATYDNLAGVAVTRILTYRRFLADGEEPDGTAVISTEIFVIDRVVRPAGGELVFEMATPVDQAKVRLPGRLVLRDHCSFHYRTFDSNNNSFNYEHVFCPYRSDQYFDVNGNPTTEPAMDHCSRKLATGCEKRYPSPQSIPFGGFPGVARFRGR